MDMSNFFAEARAPCNWWICGAEASAILPSLLFQLRACLERVVGFASDPERLHHLKQTLCCAHADVHCRWSLAPRGVAVVIDELGDDSPEELLDVNASRMGAHCFFIARRRLPFWTTATRDILICRARDCRQFFRNPMDSSVLPDQWILSESNREACLFDPSATGLFKLHKRCREPLCCQDKKCLLLPDLVALVMRYWHTGLSCCDCSH